jgi:uncharacterized protein
MPIFLSLSRALAGIVAAGCVAVVLAQPAPSPAPSPLQQPAQPSPTGPLPLPLPPGLFPQLPGKADPAAPSVAPAAPAAPAAKTGREAPRGPDGLLAVPPAAQVTDLAGVLSSAQQAQLRDKLSAFETAHGAQIAILVLPSVQPEPIADFANRVGNIWKLGRANVGDGVLIVAAIDDRRAWITVLRALEGAIPDVAARRIVREDMAPRFKQGDYAGGLSAALDSLFKLIEGEGLPTPVGVPQRTVDAGEDMLGLLLPFVLVGAFIGAGLRRAFGAPGAMVAGGGTGALAGTLLSSMLLGGIAGVVVFVLALLMGRQGLQAVGGRRGRGDGIVFLPGGGGGGSWGGGGWGGGGGGGWSSGGGGDAAGGGAGGDW